MPASDEDCSPAWVVDLCSAPDSRVRLLSQHTEFFLADPRSEIWKTIFSAPASWPVRAPFLDMTPPYLAAEEPGFPEDLADNALTGEKPLTNPMSPLGSLGTPEAEGVEESVVSSGSQMNCGISCTQSSQECVMEISMQEGILPADEDDKGYFPVRVCGWENKKVAKDCVLSVLKKMPVHVPAKWYPPALMRMLVRESSSADTFVGITDGHRYGSPRLCCRWVNTEDLNIHSNSQQMQTKSKWKTSTKFRLGPLGLERWRDRNALLDRQWSLGECSLLLSQTWGQHSNGYLIITFFH